MPTLNNDLTSGSVSHSNANYNTCRNASAGSGTSMSAVYVGQQLNAGTYWIYRGFLSFTHTAGLGVPTQMTLYIKADQFDGKSCQLVIASSPSSSVNVAFADYGAGITSTVISEVFSLNGTEGGAWLEIPINAAGKALFNSGHFNIGIRSVNDLNGVPPTGSEYDIFYSNSTDRPYISYAINSALKINGVSMSAINKVEGIIKASIKSVNNVYTVSDITAPTAPVSLNASLITETTLTLNWGSSYDLVGVTGYLVYKGGVLLATLGNVLSYNVTGLTDGTAYQFTVYAKDAAGNISLASNYVDATTLSYVSYTFYDTYQDDPCGTAYDLYRRDSDNYLFYFNGSAYVQANGYWYQFFDYNSGTGEYIYNKYLVTNNYIGLEGTANSYCPPT